MEEAVRELRAAVALALSLEPGHPPTDRPDPDGPLPRDVHAHHHGSSEGTYISSLSGSLPSERSGAALAASRRRNYYAAHPGRAGEGSDGSGGRRAGRRRRLEAATRVESAVSDCEVAVYNFHNEGVPPQIDANVPVDGPELGPSYDGANDLVLVDLLVAVLASVPKNLLQPPISTGEGVHSPQEEESYLASLEQICFNACCIASDVLRKYFLSPSLPTDSLPMLEDRHLHEMMDEVMHICEAEQSTGIWPANFDPIVGVLNSLSEGRHLDLAMMEREGNASAGDDGYQSQFACLSSKDALRMVHTLMYRHLCEKEQEQQGGESSGQACYFAGQLLAHFASVAAYEKGRDSSEHQHTNGLFEEWANGADEQMERRLNDDEARAVYDLVVRYHVGSIQSALHLVQAAETLASEFVSQSEDNEGVDENALEGLVATLQDAIRKMATVVTTTEAMDRLSLRHDPEIHVIFHPLIVRCARFNASCLHDATLLLQRTCGDAHEGEEMAILADDVLFRLCRVSIALDYLKSTTDSGEAEEVLAIALLRAMNSQCIAGNARFLLDVAADRARTTDEEDGDHDIPGPKRQRYNLGRFGSGQMPPPSRLYKSGGVNDEERRGEISDIILACLALSQSTESAGNPDPSSVRQASCITSALMFSEREEGGEALDVLDPLNPWHTLQVKPLQKLVDAADSAAQHERDDEVVPSESLRSYARSMPHLLDTKYSAFADQN